MRVGLWRKLSAEELMLLNWGVGEDSWESLGLQGDPNQSILKEISPGVYWRDWCWSWNSNTLAAWCKELTHLKRPWCWERLRAEGEGDDRGWYGWMASPTQWTWVWVNSGSWWWTGKPGMLQFMGSQRVGHNWATELNWTHLVGPELRALPTGLCWGQDHRKSLWFPRPSLPVLQQGARWEEGRVFWKEGQSNSKSGGEAQREFLWLPGWSLSSWLSSQRDGWSASDLAQWDAHKSGENNSGRLCHLLLTGCFYVQWWSFFSIL